MYHLIIAIVSWIGLDILALLLLRNMNAVHKIGVVTLGIGMIILWNNPWVEAKVPGDFQRTLIAFASWILGSFMLWYLTIAKEESITLGSHIAKDNGFMGEMAITLLQVAQGIGSENKQQIPVPSFRFEELINKTKTHAELSLDVYNLGTVPALTRASVHIVNSSEGVKRVKFTAKWRGTTERFAIIFPDSYDSIDLVAAGAAKGLRLPGNRYISNTFALNFLSPDAAWRGVIPLIEQTQMFPWTQLDDSKWVDVDIHIIASSLADLSKRTMCIRKYRIYPGTTHNELTYCERNAVG